MEKVNEQQDMSENMMDAEREAFEAAYADSQGLEEKAYALWFKKIGGEYEIAQVASAWFGWQKARASLPVGVPDGYALVPVEPTPEMLRAGVAQAVGAYPIYRAMLAAAPAVPTVKAERVSVPVELAERLAAPLPDDRGWQTWHTQDMIEASKELRALLASSEHEVEP